MTALATDRATPRRDGVDYNDPVAAGETIYAGALVVLDANRNAAAASTAVGLVVRGVAEEQVDNSGGADGDVNVATRAGVFRFNHDGSIARADIGGTAYIIDDQTLADNDGGATRSAAGTIKDVDATGVWVHVG